MDLKDLYTSGYSFEMEGKKISFKMIAYGNALKAQNAIHFIATNEPSNIAKGNELLLDLASLNLVELSSYDYWIISVV